MSKSEKVRNGGTWTEARYTSFVKSALRSASRRWKPKNDVKKAARVGRGMYQCVGYNREPHIVPLTLNKKNNVFVDHLVPIVDPVDGFSTWDDFVNGLFCEEENLQVMCLECHKQKTLDEKALRKKKNGL